MNILRSHGTRLLALPGCALLLGSVALASPGAPGGAFGAGADATAGTPESPPVASSLDPPVVLLGDDVGTLPSVEGGWDDGVWFLDDLGGPQAYDPFGSVADPLDGPSLSLTGPEAALDAALLRAEGHGFVVREELGAGLVRRSFHGDVHLVLDGALLASGAVRATVLVPDDFAPGRAVAGWGARASASLSLAPGQELGAPQRLFQPENVEGFGLRARSVLGAGYRAQFVPTANGIVFGQEVVAAP